MIYIKSRVFKRCSSSFSFRTVRSPILRQPLSRRPGAGAAFDTVHRFSGVIVSQRARFYGVSAETKLGFMQRVAGVIFLLHCKRVHVPLVMPLFFTDYILFLAESTGLRDEAAVASARERLHSFKSLEAILLDIKAV